MHNIFTMDDTLVVKMTISARHLFFHWFSIITSWHNGIFLVKSIEKVADIPTILYYVAYYINRIIFYFHFFNMVPIVNIKYQNNPNPEIVMGCICFANFISKSRGTVRASYSSINPIFLYRKKRTITI